MTKLALLAGLLSCAFACGTAREVVAVELRAEEHAAAEQGAAELLDAKGLKHVERDVLVPDADAALLAFRLTARVVDSVGQPVEGAAWSLTRTGRCWAKQVEFASGTTSAAGTIDAPLLAQLATLRVRHPRLCAVTRRVAWTPLSRVTDLGAIELAAGGTLLVTLPPEFDVHAVHGWQVRARNAEGYKLGCRKVKPGARTGRIEGLPAGDVDVRAQTGRGDFSGLGDTKRVQVVAGQTVEVQLQADPIWRGIEGLFELNASWAPLGYSVGGLNIGNSRHPSWGSDRAYSYKPAYRLFRRGELVLEFDSLWCVDPLEDTEGPFELEIEHEAMELFRSEPFHAASEVKAVVRGHCSIRFVVTSADTGRQLTDALVVISRAGAELFQQERTLGRKATITGLPPEQFSVDVEAPGHVPRKITVPALANHEQREVHVELLPAMGAHGSLVCQDRSAPAVPLELQRWSEDEWQSACTGWTDPRGKFKIAANTPGKHRVLVAYGSRPSSIEFEVTPGEFVDVGTLELEPFNPPASR